MICTYLSETDCTAKTSDSNLNVLLAEVREATGDDWRIRETTNERRRLFRRPTITRLYSLYINVGGPEFQIINFYRPEHDGKFCGSINTMNTAGHVAAYLYGVLAGCHAIQSKE